MIGRRAPELTFRIAISEFCVCSLISFIPSALLGAPVGVSGDFPGVEDIAARKYFSFYLVVVTTFCGLSDSSGSCLIALPIL